MVERGASQNTIDSYQRDLLQFQESVSDIKNATSEQIRSYLEKLTGQGLSASTRARKLSSLRQFYKFLFAEGLVDHDPCHMLESPKQGRRLPKIILEGQIDKLMGAVYKMEGPEGLRLQALVEILYASGLRITELLSLPMSSVQQAFESEVLLIRGKGGKERLVPLSEPALKSLKAYLEVRGGFGKDSLWLFPSNSKQGYLTRQRFDQLIKDLAVKAGLDRSQLSAHVLRHAFATHLLHHGADLISVQKLLGHSDISTTEIYTHVLPEHLKDMVKAHHPLAKKRAQN